jgi:hypothetical protein
LTATHRPPPYVVPWSTAPAVARRTVRAIQIAKARLRNVATAISATEGCVGARLGSLVLAGESETTIVASSMQLNSSAMRTGCSGVSRRPKTTIAELLMVGSGRGLAGRHLACIRG